MKLKKILSAALSCCILFSSGSFGAVKERLTVNAAAKQRVSVHDPSIFKDKDGTYYVFGSHIDAAKSRDLQNWQLFTNGYATTNNAIFGDLSRNLAGAFAWAGEDLEDCAGGFAVWAPDVLYNPEYVNTDGSKGAYMMYFCTSSTYMRSVIGFAVSQNAAGPYSFVDTLIYSGFTANDSFATSSTKNVNRKYTSTNIDELISAGQVTYNESWFNKSNYNNQLFPNAIDPTIYYDIDGKMHMCYGSWSGGIFTLEIDPETGRCIHPKSGQTSDGRMIDSYFGTKISGGYGKSGEAPYIRYNPDTGYYYLWVTYGGLTAQGGYNMRVFRSKNPDGPFTDPSGKAAVLPTNPNLDSVGLKVMGNYKFSTLQTAYMAPGHNSVLCDDDGQWFLFNHTRFNSGTEYHEVRVHSIYFNSDGWPVSAPYEYSGDKLAPYGYDESDIIGQYEYINHGNDTGKTIYEGQKIHLNADSTISGAVTGTWSQSKNSPDAELVIGGQVYRGVFAASQDESGTGKKVMTFAAVGNNNQTVWGVQTTSYIGTERTPKDDLSDSASKLVYKQETASTDSGAKYLSGTKLVSGVPYYIKNVNSGLLLEVKDGKTDEGTNIQQWEMNLGPHHEWRITAIDEEYCKIALMSDESMCVTIDGNSAENGLNVMLSKYTGAENQQFKLVKDGVGYGIVSKCSGGIAGLDVYEWSTKNGGNVNQWEQWGGECQLWNITPVCPAVNDGSYALRSLEGGAHLSFTGKDAGKGEKNPWIIEYAGSSNYTIRTAGGKYLTASSDNTGVFASVSDKSDSYDQLFAIKCKADGTYVISPSHYEEFALELGNSTRTEFGLIEGDYTGFKFVLEPMLIPEKVRGDVNADGSFDAADLIMMQHYLLRGEELTDPQAGELTNDNMLNVFDYVAMKRLYAEKL